MGRAMFFAVAYGRAHGSAAQRIGLEMGPSALMKP